MKLNLSIAVVSILLSPICYYAQQQTEHLNASTSTSTSTVSNSPDQTPLSKKMAINVLFVGDYGASLTENVDINGKHFSEGAPSNNGFYLRYMRVQGKLNLTKDISGQVLVNFADFKSNPQAKVLEIATVKYKLNNYATFQIGQFRPYFGLEDQYGVAVHKSYTWSNQYSLFGKNNWMSFQLGAALYGSLQDQNIPLKYYYTLSNANGKNQQGDADNNKTHSFRLEYAPTPGISLGTNVAFGDYKGESTNAYGADLSVEKKLNNKWYTALDAEYKQGSNLVAMAASTLPKKKADDFRMQGVYVTPLIRMYTDNQKFFDAVEFSCRYEYLEDLMKSGNPSRSYSPMLSFVLGTNYQSRFSLIGNISTYNKQIPNSTQWNNSQFLVQYQFNY